MSPGARFFASALLQNLLLRSRENRLTQVYISDNFDFFLKKRKLKSTEILPNNPES